ncbi:MAG TPA: cysteinyl-tRNA synthetase [Caldilineae bacterium]|nr:cysteinyl-tRNA synthetase [Caldilineae bacterium]
MVRHPGFIILFGSGETSPSGRRAWDWLFQRLYEPIRVAILETPAGFQPNSARVAERVADFVRHHLQNYHPQVTVIPARKRGTPFSPDDPRILEPLLQANVIFLGPGSPTYAVRQLRGSLAWHMLLARHRLGAAIVLASAASIAVSTHALPVYEIYKVGEELHWQEGLDFFSPYGLRLTFIPHWDNAEGGEELDTSRCFMGQARFSRLMEMLPSDVRMIGIDEHTALAVDFAAETCEVLGRHGVVLIHGGGTRRFTRGQTFALAELGPFRMPRPGEGLPPEVWRTVAASAEATQERKPPPEIQDLVRKREEARARKDWCTADALRDQILALGWRVLDTPRGPRLEPIAGDLTNN